MTLFARIIFVETTRNGQRYTVDGGFILLPKRKWPKERGLFGFLSMVLNHAIALYLLISGREASAFHPINNPNRLAEMDSIKSLEVSGNNKQIGLMPFHYWLLLEDCECWWVNHSSLTFHPCQSVRMRNKTQLI